jgi:hypothetical protein
VSRKGKLAPVEGVIQIKPKGKPRGKAFSKNNKHGLATRFQPGESGNPKGRSSEQQKAAHLLSKALIERLPQIGTKRSLKTRGRTYTQQIADVWIEQSLSGNIPAIISLSNRVEGCPASTVTVDKDGDNLTLILAHLDERSEVLGQPDGMVPRSKITGAVIDR